VLSILPLQKIVDGTQRLLAILVALTRAYAGSCKMVPAEPPARVSERLRQEHRHFSWDLSDPFDQ